MDNITIICENSINWNDLTEAKALIMKEAEIKDKTGVNVLSKHQLYSSKQILNKNHYDYCMKRILNEAKATELFEFGRSIGQKVFFTCMYPEAVDICERIGVEYYKVRYYDRCNTDILQAIADTKKPYFCSREDGYSKFTPEEIPLLCVPKYPATIWDYMRVIEPDFYETFQGISDHTPTLELFTRGLEGEVQYWEKHVRLTDGYLEDAWSVTLDQLEAVLSQ